MTKLTIEKIVDDCCIDSYFVPFGFNKKALQHSIQTYAAQQNAELAAENERLKNEIDCPYCTENEQLKAENERLKQQLAWQAKVNDAAYQRGYEEAERLGNIEIERLEKVLKAVIENDKTYYNHHEPRPDGLTPKEIGGTIWITPREWAKSSLAATDRPEYKEVS